MSDKGHFTKTPNEILEAMALMGEAESRLTAVLVRLTYGYHKQEVKLTYNAMQEATGLSRGGVSNATNAVIERGFFRRGNKSMWFADSLLSRPKSTSETDEIVYSVDQNSLLNRLKSIDYSLPSRLKQSSLKEIEEKEKNKDNNNRDESVPVIQAFTEKTGFMPPHDTTRKWQDDWQVPAMGMIQATGNLESTINLINQSVDILWAKKYSFTSPNGILNTFINLHGQSKANGNGQNSSDLWQSQVSRWIDGKSKFSDLSPPVRNAIKQIGGDGLKNANNYAISQAKKKFSEIMKG